MKIILKKIVTDRLYQNHNRIMILFEYKLILIEKKKLEMKIQRASVP